MSSLKLLISGSLVASGLVLGAFTLHGAFEPSSVKAAGRQEARSEPKGIAAFQTKTESGGQDSALKTLVKAGAKQEAKAPPKSADAQADEAKARAAEERRRRAEQKRAEKAEKEKAEREKLAKANQEAQPRQATLWPWDYWFGNE
jgi:hypothetical protein